MLRKMPGRLAGSMQEVVGAVVAKLAAAQSSPLITSLLIVLAQLVHANARPLLDFLASQPAPGEGCPGPQLLQHTGNVKDNMTYAASRCMAWWPGFGHGTRQSR